MCYFAIQEALLEAGRAHNLMDMLRYDSAAVVTYESGFWVLSTERVPSIARWDSFGLTPLRTHFGHMGFFLSRDEALCAVRARACS